MLFAHIEISIIAILFAKWAKSAETVRSTEETYLPRSYYTPKTKRTTGRSYRAKRTHQASNKQWEAGAGSNHTYQNRSVFSEREKAAFVQIKSIVEPYGYTVLAKVRLFDLVEPSYLTDNKKVAQYKIQAKHVDFVLCDSTLKARYVIELDDTTHDRPDRIERDRFVDSVLEMSGYRVLHTRGINENEILHFIGII